MVAWLLQGNVRIISSTDTAFLYTVVIIDSFSVMFLRSLL